MSELLPCPFCGSGWLYETRRNGYCDETPTMFCNSCKAVVTWEQVEEEGVNDETITFVREHWNSRAERIYATGGIIAQAECRDVCASISEFTCSSCGFNCDLTSWISLFDGDSGRHRHHHFGTPNYCPNCGAKVTPKCSETTPKVVGE